MKIEIKAIDQNSVQEWFDLRLESLKTHPTIYLSTYDFEFNRGVDFYNKNLNGLFGAYFQNEMIGIIGLIRSKKEKIRHKANIWGLYVKQIHTRKDVAKKLIHYIINYAKNVGIESLTLTVASTNPSAIKLYESFNFKKWGIEPDAVREGKQSVDDFYFHLKV